MASRFRAVGSLWTRRIRVQEDHPLGLLTGNVPSLQLVSLHPPEPVTLKRKPHALGIDHILRARQADAQKQNPHLLPQ